MKVEEAINKRRSVRSFSSKAVKFGNVIDSIDAALKGPLAGNINTLKFIIVTNPETKQKLARAADQLWVEEADTIVVVCSDEEHLTKLYHDRGIRYAAQQVGAAIENMLLRLTGLGLSACWVGGFVDESIKLALLIPEHIVVEAMIPIGYTKEKPALVKKAELENVLYWEKWDVKNKPTLVKDPSTR